MKSEPSVGELPPDLVFGPFTVSQADERLIGPEGPIKLGHKAFEVLVELIRQDGLLVTKDALFASVWDGTIVSESALTSAVKELRRALGDESKAPRYIESVYGRGYRFLVPISQVPAAVGLAQSPANGRTGAYRLPRLSVLPVSRRAAVAGAIGAGTLAAVGVGGWQLLRPSEASAKRIAVLPFANLSGSPEQAYFAEGFAEELRSALSRLGIEVIGRASSQSVKDLDSRDAARQLGVPYLLAGSVRRSSEFVRITAQLVSGADAVERWAQSYDRAVGDQIKIQTDIAASVARALDIILSQGKVEALNLGGTSDSAAQDLVMKAREVRRTALEGNIQKCLALVDSAISRDPEYALAHFEKSTLHIFLAMRAERLEEMLEYIELANDSADRALSIAPAMGLAHLAKFNVEQARLNFSAALTHLQRALALAPDEPDILLFSPSILAQLGEEPEAVRLADRALVIDPLNAAAYVGKAVVLFWLRQYPQAIEACRRALEMQPENPWPSAGIGMCLMLQGKPQDGLSAFQRLPKNSPWRVWGEAMVAARTGYHAAAEQGAAELRGRNYVYQQALILAALARRDEAFAALDDALANRDPSLINLKKDPFIDPLRSDPRLGILLRKVNFPA